MGSRFSGQASSFYSFTAPRLTLQTQRWREISRGQTDLCASSILLGICFLFICFSQMFQGVSWLFPCVLWFLFMTIACNAMFLSCKYFSQSARVQWTWFVIFLISAPSHPWACMSTDLSDHILILQELIKDCCKWGLVLTNHTGKGYKCIESGLQCIIFKHLQNAIVCKIRNIWLNIYLAGIHTYFRILSRKLQISSFWHTKQIKDSFSL